MTQWFEVPRNISWISDRTVVRCFDDQDNEVLVVDGATGLKWMFKELDGKFFQAVDETCLPKGRYQFDGVYILNSFHDGDRVTAHVTTHGNASGAGYVPFTSAGSPWSFAGSVGVYVTWPERQTRLADCYSCKKFDSKNGVCTVDGSFMAMKTINAAEECPDKVWGVSKDFDPVEAEKRRQEAYKHMTEWADQAKFESEWEEHRAG
jgi:hypothetical protein